MTPAAARLRRAMVPAALCLVMAGVAAWAYAYHAGARAVPLLVAWTTIVLLALEILVQSGTAPGRAVDRTFSGARREKESPAPGVSARDAAAVGWVVGLVAAIFVFGILPAIPVYVFLFMLVNGRKKPAHAAIAAAAVTAFVWIVFEGLMSYQLFRGLLFGQFAGL